MIVGGIHGNEPAGRLALAAVASRLEQLGGVSRGQFTGLVGNVRASVAETRFVDVDLNRCWDEDSSRSLSESGDSVVESIEYLELLATLGDVFRESRGDVYLLDLHTTSGPGFPFCVFADCLRIRSFARRFSIPVILGFEEELRGTLIDHVAELGHIAIAIEGGQHDDPQSVSRLEAAIWIALRELDMLAAEARASASGSELTRGGQSLPTALEVVYRHEIGARDEFTMLDGFSSFDRVESGQLLARCNGGEVRSPETGFLLMPLYQQQGDDGFFLARRVNPFWLWLSSLLRRLRLSGVAHWLPGVSKTAGESSNSDELDVDLDLARWYALELLHLLGFRRVQRRGTRLRVQRRAYDLHGPSPHVI